MQNFNYPFEMRPLTVDEGGGWLITFPDLPGCMSDGETPEEAIENGTDALACWIEACQAEGRDVPQPGDALKGLFTTRLPKTLHKRLLHRAQVEGVSPHILVTSLIAEYMGEHEISVGYV